jgi:hypothetical protein
VRLAFDHQEIESLGHLDSTSRNFPAACGLTSEQEYIALHDGAFGQAV